MQLRAVSTDGSRCELAGTVGSDLWKEDECRKNVCNLPDTTGGYVQCLRIVIYDEQRRGGR